jgi:hypothetical protein
MKNSFLALTLVILGISAVANAATRVSSDSNCPSSDAISLRLLGILAAGGPTNASARVHADGQSIRIEVSTPGEHNHERTVPATGDCETQAETAALIIAAWLDAMPVGTISSPGGPPRDVRTRPRQENGKSDDMDDPAESTKPPITMNTRMLVGVGLFGLADTTGANTGLALEGRMPNLLEKFGWSVEASLGLRRQLGLGGGTVSYWRPTLVVTATMDIYSTKKWISRLQIGPVLGILSYDGSGYTVRNSSTTVMWGGIAGISLARAWKRSEGWLRIDSMGWPQGRRFLAKSNSTSPVLEALLPAWEIRLTAGFSMAIL